MQGDAPYEESPRSSSTWQHGTSSSFPLSSSSSSSSSSRRHNQRNSSGGGSKGSGNRIKQSGEEGASRSSNKVFHKVDPPRGRVGQQHRSRGLASSSFNEPAGSSSRIQGYATVVEKPYHPAATKSSRSRAAETVSPTPSFGLLKQIEWTRKSVVHTCVLYDISTANGLCLVHILNPYSFPRDERSLITNSSRIVTTRRRTAVVEDAGMMIEGGVVSMDVAHSSGVPTRPQVSRSFTLPRHFFFVMEGPQVFILSACLTHLK